MAERSAMTFEAIDPLEPRHIAAIVHNELRPIRADRPYFRRCAHLVQTGRMRFAMKPHGEEVWLVPSDAADTAAPDVIAHLRPDGWRCTCQPGVVPADCEHIGAVLLWTVACQW